MDSYPGPYGQVLTNLVLNALVHAFPDNRTGAMRLTAKAIGSFQVEIEFADDGIGMSAEVQRRAFEPFFTTRRNRGGTGLGLHIVYNLVTRRLGGRLRLESDMGRGTDLPDQAAADRPERRVRGGGTDCVTCGIDMTDDNDLMRVIEDADAAAPDQPLPAWKVAVIDDDPAVHEGTRFALYDYTLNGQGIEIISAYSAEEGRELMRTSPTSPSFSSTW